jgi:hypothetical protein
VRGNGLLLSRAFQVLPGIFIQSVNNVFILHVHGGLPSLVTCNLNHATDIDGRTVLLGAPHRCRRGAIQPLPPPEAGSSILAPQQADNPEAAANLLQLLLLLLRRLWLAVAALQLPALLLDGLPRGGRHAWLEGCNGAAQPQTRHERRR